MNKNQLIHAVNASVKGQKNIKMNRRGARVVVNAVLETILNAIKDEGYVVLPGFGRWKVKTSDVIQYNFKTKEKKKVTGYKAVRFKVGSRMKKAGQDNS